VYIFAVVHIMAAQTSLTDRSPVLRSSCVQLVDD